MAKHALKQHTKHHLATSRRVCYPPAPRAPGLGVAAPLLTRRPSRPPRLRGWPAVQAALGRLLCDPARRAALFRPCRLPPLIM